MNRVTLLSSGNSLGVYVPAVQIQYQLRKRGIPASVDVLENVFYDEKKSRMKETKRTFHLHFSAALLGHKLARDIRPSLDPDKVELLLNKWEAERRTRFMVFTGFWIPILEAYKRRMDAIRVDVVHIDSVYSPSFAVYEVELRAYRHVWLFDYRKRQLAYRIPIGSEPLVPYERRERVLIHGGGWGIGTYQSKIPELRERGIPLSIIAYYPDEVAYPDERYYMADPDWSPWHANGEGEHTFPPFAEVKTGEPLAFATQPEYPKLFDVIRHSLAIVSKPGGSTLVDSLASATPVVFLEPFGDHERKNAELWETLGFGISYQRWQEDDFSTDLLHRCHRNLEKARLTPIDYGGTYDAT